jgi:hypothetical protein
MTVPLREKEIACTTVEKPRIAQEAPTDSTGRSVLPDRFVWQSASPTCCDTPTTLPVDARP